MADKKEHNADFRFLVRIQNTDLDGKKPTAVALTYVPGVGRRLAPIVARNANVSLTEPIGNLKDDQILALQEALNFSRPLCDCA